MRDFVPRGTPSEIARHEEIELRLQGRHSARRLAQAEPGPAETDRGSGTHEISRLEAMVTSGGAVIRGEDAEREPALKLARRDPERAAQLDRAHGSMISGGQFATAATPVPHAMRRILPVA